MAMAYQNTPPRRAPRINPMTVVLGLAVATLLVIVVYPLVWLLLAALGLPGDIGLNHFMRAYARSQNVQPLINTIILAIGAGIFSVILGVPLAWATACTDMPLRKTVRACVALSYITPPYLTALAFIILLGPEAGYLNRLARLIVDVPTGPFNVFGMAGIIGVISLHVFAFTFFLTEAALKSVDASLEEAAQMLGARRWTTVVRINLPLVAPAITGGALLAAVESLALFGPQSFLGTPAQISFLPTRIYGVISSYPPRWGEAAALSLILILLTCIGLLIQRSYLQRRSYVTIGGKGGRSRPARLGPWKWLLLGLCLLIVFFSAIAPIGVLVLASFSDSWVQPLQLDNFTIHHFRTALLEDQMAVRGIWNSFRLATGAGLIAVVIGAAIAYIDLRTRVTGRKLLDYLALLPLGLPGTVMAIGLLLAFIRPPLVLYGTIWILLVAYVARFIPLATRSVNSSLRQLDPSLEEAARITGATWLQSIRLILLPLVRPGLVVAFLLVFIPAFAELSATVLLYASGTETISIAIFRLNDLGQLEVVAALSVFTIAVVLAVSLCLNWYSGLLPKRRSSMPKD